MNPKETCDLTHRACWASHSPGWDSIRKPSGIFWRALMGLKHGKRTRRLAEALWPPLPWRESFSSITTVGNRKKRNLGEINYRNADSYREAFLSATHHSPKTSSSLVDAHGRQLPREPGCLPS